MDAGGPGALHGYNFFAHGRPQRSVHYHATTTSGQGTGHRLLRLRGEAGVTRGTTVIGTDVVATEGVRLAGPHSHNSQD